jgi:hypothetical protein
VYGDAVHVQPEGAGGGVGDVLVGGEVVGVGQQQRSAGPQPGGGGERVVQLHAGGVAAHDLPGSGADETADRIADPGGGLPPAVVVPRADQVGAPLAADRVLYGAGHRGGKRAQGVPVEVGDTVWEEEPVAQGG